MHSTAQHSIAELSLVEDMLESEKVSIVIIVIIVIYSRRNSFCSFL